MKMGRLFLAIVSSALLLAASFPNRGIGILAWVGLAPLLFALRQRGPVTAAGLGFLFGSLWGIGVFYWIHFIIPTNLSKAALIFFECSLFFGIFGLLYRLIYNNHSSWMIIWAPALLVAMEYIKSNIGFASLPWNLLGHTQYRYLAVIQIADITGVYGISFVIVMVNQYLSQLPDQWHQDNSSKAFNFRLSRILTRQTLVVGLSIFLLFLYGWMQPQVAEDGERIRIALIQANVVPTTHMSSARQRKHLQAYEPLTREAAAQNPDLIVWPTSSLPAPLTINRVVRRTVMTLARETGSYLLVGGTGYEKNKPRQEGYLPFSNSEFLIAPSGRIEGQYDKIRLLPFNEYLPLRGKFNWPKWITTLEKSYIPGKKYTVFKVLNAKFGTPICWENMFANHFRRFVKDGANLMISLTNEGFYGRNAAPYQTLAANVFRAVENRVAIVRSATTGVSAFINSNGEIIERIQDNQGDDLFVPGYLVRDVPLSDDKTFYTIHGDVFAYASMVTAVLMTFIALYGQIWTHLPAEGPK